MEGTTRKRAIIPKANVVRYRFIARFIPGLLRKMGAAVSMNNLSLGVKWASMEAGN
jgi:hypothetical protein